MNQLGEPGVAEVAGLGDAYDVWSRPNVWPERPAGFKETWLEYYRQVSDLSADLMRLCALGLGLDEEFFTPSSTSTARTSPRTGTRRSTPTRCPTSTARARTATGAR
ncbi:hypothetical protein ACFQV8_19395 [Pseudonocardia benzenivorans]